MSTGNQAMFAQKEAAFDSAVIGGNEGGFDAQTRFVVDVEGFEGPLDLLLSMAREQKVDITRISILALADQYLLFIGKIRDRRVEIAADYLVMAAWLAYLKSRLLLPGEQEGEDEEPSGEYLASLLQFRLQRLQAIREAGKKLILRPQLGRDFFARGQEDKPEGQRREERIDSSSTMLYDLLQAYAQMRTRNFVPPVTFAQKRLWTLQHAYGLLSESIGVQLEWTNLVEFLIPFLDDGEVVREIMVAGFTASLELVKNGEADLRQSGTFSPIYLRAREAGNGAQASIVESEIKDGTTG